MSSSLSDFGQFGKHTWTDSVLAGRGGSSTSGSSAERDRADDAGAWPEEMNIRYPASINLTIPGMSDQPESCGTYYPSEFCGECGEPSFGVSRCENRDCPECWSTWSGKSAARITRRLAAKRHSLPNDASRRTVHAMVSPPPGSVTTIEDFHDLKREAYQLAKDQGVRGGVAIPHGYRVEDATKREFERLKELHQDDSWDYHDPALDAGIWRWIRERADDWRKHVYWSPHVHIIGLARDVEEIGTEARDGWVCKRLSTLDEFQIDDADGYDAMMGTARYILSHTTYDPHDSKQSVRWFGKLAPAAFSPDEALSDDELDLIESMTEEVRYGSQAGDDDEECESCGAHDLHPIWEARQALQQKRFCERIGKATQQRLSVAADWATGEAHPPPGLRNPSTEDEAREAFNAMLS